MKVPTDQPLEVLIAGGGTAGHLLPGLAIAAALTERGVAVSFAGGNRGVERKLVGAAGYPLTELPGRGLQRRFTLGNLSALASLIRGLATGVNLVRRSRPDVVVVLGGYASFAVGVGAVVARRPLVLCEQNARAGAVNRLLRHWARRSVVSFEGTDLPRSVVTGNPLRPELVEAARVLLAEPVATRRAAREALDLPDDRVVVLVTTGSLGARRVNDAVIELMGRWRDREDLAVRHVTGRRDFAQVRERTGDLVGDAASTGACYQVIEYEERMDLALSAADLAVTRAGGTVAELALFGVPAVLVPLPIAPRDHQRANAQQLVAAGGSLLLDDQDCDADHLAALLGPLLGDGPKRSEMANAMRASSHPDAADEAARVVLEVVGVN